MRRSVATSLLFLGTLATMARAASPAICYAVASGNWNTPAIWASSSGGAGGTCTASGGSGVTIMGATATLAAGVPGASGSQDRAEIAAGVTVQVGAGVGVDLGEASYNSPHDSLTVDGATSASYGTLVIDAGGLVRLHGGSSSADNFAIIQQYGVLQVEPNGSLWIGTSANGPQVAVSGRLYVGCADQSAYPSPDCSANAGTWVTPSVASTLNFTSASLPTGIVAGDLVELSPTPQPLSFPYPYNIDGVTPPPLPPVMPETSDTGTSPMKTCGSASDCVVPRDTLLCVVQVSGNAVSLGWPQGGTPAQPYCTGTETAMAISNAGVGKLWMKKPAFLWGDPTRYTWNNTTTFAPSSQIEQMDGTRSGIWVAGTGDAGPISNAAGTGPGRFGDNSLSVGSSNWGAPCTFLTIPDVTSAGCWLDYDSGSMVAYGSQLSFTGSMSYDYPTKLVQMNGGGLVIPAGTRSYNELVIANSDLRYIYNGGSYAAFIQFSGLPNTANNHMAFVGNTVEMSRGEVGLNGTSLTNTTPLEITGNSFGSAQIDRTYQATPHIEFTGTSNYVNISDNYLDDYGALFACELNVSSGSSTQTFDHVTAVNNQIAGNYFNGADNYNTCNWTNLFVADNRITANGAGDGTGESYAVAFSTLNSTTPNAKNVFQDNYVYGDFRGFFSSSGQHWTQNYFAYQWHHVGTVTSYDSLTGNPGGYISGVQVDHNVMVANSSQSMPCFNSGYDEFSFIDGLTFDHNTCVVNSPTPGNHASGGFEIGDSDAGSTAIAGLQVTNNIFALPTGIFKTFQGSPNFEQAGLVYAGWNSAQSTNAMYSGFATNPNSIPNPEVNRTVSVTQGGVNYNTSSTRNITGVAIQNPTYTTVTTGCLQYSYTSQSSITLAWSVDASCGSGAGFGTPVQLNWGGAATTYAVTSAAAGPGGTNTTGMTLTVSGTPFTAMPSGTTGVPVPAGCPIARWAWVTSGADVGHAYGITSCPGSSGSPSGQLAVAPNATATIGTPTVAVMKWEVRLFDGGGSDYVDVGIDPRSLPNPGTATTLTDTGISVTPTDYCGAAEGCARVPVASGLSVAFPVALPIQGGSAEQALCGGQLACGGTSFYAPSGSTWTTASDTGSYIGAVPFFSNAVMVPRHGASICCRERRP